MTVMHHKIPTKLSVKEEIGNSVSHGVGAMLFLLLLPFSAVYSYVHYGIVGAIGISLFVTSLFLMLLSSTIYHSMKYGSRQKYVLRILDHSMIFVAIAGSYTPVILLLMPTWMGYTILAIEWMITIGGIVYKALSHNMSKKISLSLYITMGWLVVLVFPTLIAEASPLFLTLMTVGGCLYTIGAVVYTRKRPYAHFVWHLFILAATSVHYVAIMFFMV